MLSRNDILETIRMIDQQHLDIRTITMGISLLSCADSSAERACEKIYDKISRYAEHLVATGEEIEREFGIPIVNKRVSVTPSRWSPPRRRRKTMSRLPRRLTARPKMSALTLLAVFRRLCKRA